MIGKLEVSLVGLGCNNFGMRIDEEATNKVVHAALDEGITLFDTADVYGGTKSEEFLGGALGKRRDDVVVATKFGMPVAEDKKGAKPEYVKQAVDASLRRLGTDWIDLYQLHAPDPETPIDDTLGALNDLVAEGKVREIGCSNFKPDQIEEAAQASETLGVARFVSVQNHLNLLHRQGLDELLEACERFELGILPYFPLASGLLTGKYSRDEAPPQGTRLSMLPEERRGRVLNDENFDRVERLEKFAESRGRTILELAFAWLAGLPHMASVIAGATKPEQVKANVGAVAWKLTDDERGEVDEITAR